MARLSEGLRALPPEILGKIRALFSRRKPAAVVHPERTGRNHAGQTAEGRDSGREEAVTPLRTSAGHPRSIARRRGPGTEVRGGGGIQGRAGQT